ncbi:snare associated Golgi protein-domain-containing protein [Irpex rosettiformis]|uniref:Snare associated Golgi protein-domain-containing protein n=1 Tax=Irpex rosettiformis TaxID=378272 RepID=A0ACB8U782_9APHY|nr:snare associated Golgi protein-domain-containing protein [Irpex rosettiformis]
MASTYPAYGGQSSNFNTSYQTPYDPYAPYPVQGSVDSDISQTVTVPGIKKQGDVRVEVRALSRTPSPTPSEQAELKKTGLFDWKAMAKWRYWFRREWLWYYVGTIIIVVITILFTVYHKQIVKALQPTANKLKDLPGGWLIPIAIFVVISFPPLFGHEILAILCGLVWGLGIGFAIVAAGTFLGEVANFYAFRYCCAARGEKLEKQKIQYACLAKVVRDGGFKIALIARFSAIPGHFTTAVFSTCGMSIWTFAIAAFFSLPKQFLTVYLGVALEASESGQSSTKDTIIRDTVIGVTTVVTFGAMWYIYHLMNKAKPEIIYQRRKERQAKLQAANSLPYNNPGVLESTDSVVSGRKSESELPLTASFQTPGFQQWDNQGRAVGYAPDPALYAPQPQRPVKITAPPTFRSQNSTPTMSERLDGRAQPIRSNTGGSSASWDVQAQVGPNSYQMSQQHTQYPEQTPLPPRIPPPNSNPQTRTNQTPTQAHFPYPGDAGHSRVASPHSSAPTPAPAYSPPQGPPPSQAYPPPLPSDVQRGHYAAPTDTPYYSAYNGVQ